MCFFALVDLTVFVRNLTIGEIVEQMLHLQLLLNKDERLSHIVVMGMGEPLANLNNLLSGLEIATNDKGLGISARRITIFHCGLFQMELINLSQLNRRYNLAVSLHAT